MSRWLRNVGQLLEKLDDHAEKVVDERLLTATLASVSGHGTEAEDDSFFEQQRITRILEARGLGVAEVEEEDAGGGEEHFNKDSDCPVVAAAEADDHRADNDVLLHVEGDVDVANPIPSHHEIKTESAKESSVTNNDTPSQIHVALVEPQWDIMSDRVDSSDIPKAATDRKIAEAVHSDTDGGSLAHSRQQKNRSSSTNSNTAVSKAPQGPAANRPPIPAIQDSIPSGKPPPVSNTQSSQLREMQKELRTLRRHVVSLHSQLEKAEAEIHAQRDELDRAAERIEKDHARYKHDKEEAKQQHASEIKILKENHEQAIAEAKKRSDTLLEQTREQMRALELRHMEEGGDWNKELADALEREKDTLRKLAALEDERATFLSQISTLQAQQEALGSRLESLTETADNAMARERDAEDRLDEALSTHARQISLRNARESELEERVAELSAALVAARSNFHSISQSTTKELPASESSNDFVRQNLENEIENLRVQLRNEQQRSDVLERELRDVTRERTNEVSLATSQQLGYDRRMSEMSHEIAQLKRELLETRELSSRDNRSSELSDTNQIRSLSEEVLRLRESVMNSSSEVKALQSRLSVAQNRATQAEAALEKAKHSLLDVDTEMGTTRVRRKGGRSRGDGSRGSMKSALRLDASQSEASLQLGLCLDVVDDSLSKSGSLLKINPFARLIFVLYLLVLHIWTFLLIMFHAHGSFEMTPKEAVLPHGPHALMMQGNVANNVEMTSLDAAGSGS